MNIYEVVVYLPVRVLLDRGRGAVRFEFVERPTKKPIASTSDIGTAAVKKIKNISLNEINSTGTSPMQ